MLEPDPNLETPLHEKEIMALKLLDDTEYKCRLLRYEVRSNMKRFELMQRMEKEKIMENQLLTNPRMIPTLSQTSERLHHDPRRELFAALHKIQRKAGDYYSQCLFQNPAKRKVVVLATPYASNYERLYTPVEEHSVSDTDSVCIIDDLL